MIVGFRVSGLGLGFTVSGLGFRVWGLGMLPQIVANQMRTWMFGKKFRRHLRGTDTNCFVLKHMPSILFRRCETRVA